MLEVFLGALAALAARDLFYELYRQYKKYRYKKDLETLWELAEDYEADDDFQKRQKTPQPRVITLGRGVSCCYGPARALKWLL